ncbi:hypothetical protein H1S01_19325 [Heliobacterium chlorum]|uniref:Uncharacterized protein n=1 Tax=Heliobacterium chlorum TaxID=2698 RepID=A0ABR7T759_HELCL|nr:hypothetical protein [Heliobacterium chlorum]MBC9786599.1 hypothetical protein [Heliobacterium chlorum]
MGNKKQLFEILLDPSSNDAEKDDAVIELGDNYDDEETIDFLIEVSNLYSNNDMIAASCGESIGLVYVRTQKIDYEKICKLKGTALSEALSLIKKHRIDWYESYLCLNSQKKTN